MKIEQDKRYRVCATVTQIVHVYVPEARSERDAIEQAKRDLLDGDLFGGDFEAERKELICEPVIHWAELDDEN